MLFKFLNFITIEKISYNYISVYNYNIVVTLNYREHKLKLKNTSIRLEYISIYV